MRIGTAGWSIPRDVADSFPGEGQQLQRYARVLGCAEINSSFYRSHLPGTWTRWGEQVPADFRFAVKVPRTITHDSRLRAAREPLQRFLAEVGGLGEKLGVLLVQLPPSFAFDAHVVETFFQLLAEQHGGPVVCEPRHASWFTPAVDAALAALRVSRAAADPARWPDAARPGGWLGPDGDGAGAVLYHRWHGSPRMYWSRYDADWMNRRVEELSAWSPQADRWCIFDNTAAGAATVNALELQTSMTGTR